MRPPPSKSRAPGVVGSKRAYTLSTYMVSVAAPAAPAAHHMRRDECKAYLEHIKASIKYIAVAGAGASAACFVAAANCAPPCCGETATPALRRTLPAQPLLRYRLYCTWYAVCLLYRFGALFPVFFFAFLPHIYFFPLDFAAVARRILSASNANTPRKVMRRELTFSVKIK